MKQGDAGGGLDVMATGTLAVMLLVPPAIPSVAAFGASIATNLFYGGLIFQAGVFIGKPSLKLKNRKAFYSLLHNRIVYFHE